MKFEILIISCISQISLISTFSYHSGLLLMYIHSKPITYYIPFLVSIGNPVTTSSSKAGIVNKYIHLSSCFNKSTVLSHQLLHLQFLHSMSCLSPYLLYYPEEIISLISCIPTDNTTTEISSLMLHLFLIFNLSLSTDTFPSDRTPMLYYSLI